MLMYYFAKPIINNIIIPHGMTDFIHAKLHRQIPQLCSIYASTTLCSVLMTPFLQYPEHIHPFFLCASAIHFRTDMPAWGQNRFSKSMVQLLQLLQSTLLIGLFSITHNIEFFLLYMVVLHVPNHYRNAWSFIRKDLYSTILSITGCQCTLLLLEHIWGPLMKPDISNHIPLPVQFGVVAHILYNELYVLTESPLYQKRISMI